MEENLFNAIMTLPSKDTTYLLKGIFILNKYIKISLETDETGSVRYFGDVNELKKSKITSDELTDIRNGGWFIEKDKIIKKLK